MSEELKRTHPKLYSRFIRQAKGLKKLISDIRCVYPDAYLRVYEGGIGVIPSESCKDHQDTLVTVDIGHIDSGFGEKNEKIIASFDMEHLDGGGELFD